MDKIHRLLDSLETACESEGALLSFVMPEVNSIMSTINGLPEAERDAVRDRLDRIGTIIEGQMMLYSEELAKLGNQIRSTALSNAASNSYRTIAVIPIRDKAANS